ncbi:MAG: hypothetical protein KGO92_14970 [Bacteroidota bacterium]|nr:hypothetical protein [Bacteroidota bacterium]
MRSIILSVVFSVVLGTVSAQQQTAEILQQTARSLVQKGDYDNAVLVLDRARKQEPDNIEILRDLCYANYLKRDFSKAIEVGKDLIDKPNADEQSFQVLGLAYKAIASYKECGKLYRNALRIFPKSGVLYSEYGELLAIENQMDDAIAQWEKGIELAPSYSSNYYNASIYYGRKNNWIRSALYAELFLNLESYSTRTEEIKKQLFADYQHLWIPGEIQNQLQSGSVTAFEKAVLSGLSAARQSNLSSGSIDDIIGVRSRFLTGWMQQNAQKYPYALFDRWQYLLNQGLFPAYHYWLFKTEEEVKTVEQWQKDHPKDTEGFSAFQQSRVFKIPDGQYYHN